MAKTVAPVDGSTAGVGAVYFVTNGSGDIVKSGASPTFTFTWVISHGIGRFPVMCQVFGATGIAVNASGYGVKPGAKVTFTNIVRVSGSTTVTVSATAHGLSDGDKVSVSSATGAGVNGIFTVNTSAPDSFTYLTPGITSAASGSVGEVFGNLANKCTVQYLGTASVAPGANTVKAVLIG